MNEKKKSGVEMPASTYVISVVANKNVSSDQIASVLGSSIRPENVHIFYQQETTDKDEARAPAYEHFLSFITSNYLNLSGDNYENSPITFCHVKTLEQLGGAPSSSSFMRIPASSDPALVDWLRKSVDKHIDTFLAQNSDNSLHAFADPDHFCVRRELVLSRPLDFYTHLLKQHKQKEPQQVEHLAHGWYYVFNVHREAILDEPDYVVVGSGLSGSVLAEQISRFDSSSRILIVEKREHLGGNCFDYVDEATGVRVSKYGPHIFHTNDERVWSYVNAYSEWLPYTHKVYGRLAATNGRIFPIPLNITSVNTLLGTQIADEAEMRAYLESVRDKSIDERVGGPANSEEFCLQKFGQQLYELVFKHYTKKQWDKYPAELEADLLRRLPLRYDHSEGYFRDKYQAMPKYGYTPLIANIMDQPNILAIYATDYIAVRAAGRHKWSSSSGGKVTVFTGPIDHYYKAYGYEALEYRSIEFEHEVLDKSDTGGFYQEAAQINYPGPECPYTRITEHKHFWPDCQSSRLTIISRETSTDVGDPYYPVPNEKNRSVYDKYRKLSEQDANVIFLGRLASYKYFNMDQAILNSLQCYDSLVERGIIKQKSDSTKKQT